MKLFTNPCNTIFALWSRIERPNNLTTRICVILLLSICSNVSAFIYLRIYCTLASNGITVYPLEEADRGPCRIDVVFLKLLQFPGISCLVLLYQAVEAIERARSILSFFKEITKRFGFEGLCGLSSQIATPRNFVSLHQNLFVFLGYLTKRFWCRWVSTFSLYVDAKLVFDCLRASGLGTVTLC